MGLRDRFLERMYKKAHFVINELLWGFAIAGVVIVLIQVMVLPEGERDHIGIGVSFIIAGSIGIYMMFTTKRIAEDIHNSLDGISEKIDTMSVNISDKIDTMSVNISDKIDTMSGKIDTMSDRISGKIDTMSGELSDKMDRQTDILVEIRDALVDRSGAQKPS